MRLRYLTLGILLTILSPMIRETVIYAGEVKSVYDQIQEISKTDVVLRIAMAK